MAGAHAHGLFSVEQSWHALEDIPCNQGSRQLGQPECPCLSN